MTSVVEKASCLHDESSQVDTEGFCFTAELFPGHTLDIVDFRQSGWKAVEHCSAAHIYEVRSQVVNINLSHVEVLSCGGQRALRTLPIGGTRCGKCDSEDGLRENGFLGTIRSNV